MTLEIFCKTLKLVGKRPTNHSEKVGKGWNMPFKPSDTNYCAPMS